jgi:type I restriction enzyme M protein
MSLTEAYPDHPSVTAYELSKIYARAHDIMRNTDGLHPQEAFEELLKYLFLKEQSDQRRCGKLSERLERLPEKGVDLNADDQIRKLFREYLSGYDNACTSVWPEQTFRLSPGALTSLHNLFGQVDFQNIDFDVRSSALKIFLTPDIRRGLGIYLTPDDVARMMVEVVSPEAHHRVYDPACGSGTFLIEVLRFWRERAPENKSHEIWGSDINPRMLLLSELNLGFLPAVTFNRQSVDLMSSQVRVGKRPWPKAGTYDVIFTNPPFGVVLDSRHVNFSEFATCIRRDGSHRERQTSEVVFFEQCMHLLKPGGVLAIVLPRSVLTNSGLGEAREALDRLGYVERVVMLPPETFAVTGTQTTTVVVFARKHELGRATSRTVSMSVADITNVGFDATGRARVDNQLPELSLHKLSDDEGTIWRRLRSTDVQQTLSQLGSLIARRFPSPQATIPLRELVVLATTGRTPSRAAYTDKGLFILKVGNLSGHGIDWRPRDRNFIGEGAARKRRESEALMLQEHDIVLTSSAHVSKYIAKKVDIISDIPEYIGAEATFVGEVMLIRPNPGRVDPFVLLAFLRKPETALTLQRMVRGQTAHLMQHDVLDLEVPANLTELTEAATQLRTLIQMECDLTTKLNKISRQIAGLLGELGQAATQVNH